jgi:hypothetical protein
VAVDLLHVKAETRRLFGDVAVGQDVVRGTVQLVAVVVDEVNDIVQLVGIGEVEALPDLALVGLAVADDAVDIVVPAVEPRRWRWTRPAPGNRWSGPRRG